MLGEHPYEDFWALKDINFEMAEGETVGILGRNGSGKSTLLKCIVGHPAADRRARSSCGAAWPLCSSSGPASSPSCRAGRTSS